MTHYLNFINNQWLASDTCESFDIDNPATEAVIASVSAAITPRPSLSRMRLLCL